MELKLNKTIPLFDISGLWIVPNGIETRHLQGLKDQFPLLWIVPNGIETRKDP